MLFARRVFLLAYAVPLPAALTWLSYRGVALLLTRTDRYIDHQVLQFAAVIQFAAFFFITVLEVRARWSPKPSA